MNWKSDLLGRLSFKPTGGGGHNATSLPASHSSLFSPILSSSALSLCPTFSSFGARDDQSQFLVLLTLVTDSASDLIGLKLGPWQLTLKKMTWWFPCASRIAHLPCQCVLVLFCMSVWCNLSWWDEEEVCWGRLLVPLSRNPPIIHPSFLVCVCVNNSERVTWKRGGGRYLWGWGLGDGSCQEKPHCCPGMPETKPWVLSQDASSPWGARRLWASVERW